MKDLLIISQLIVAISVLFVWVFRFHNVEKEFKQFGLSITIRSAVGASKIALATLLKTFDLVKDKNQVDWSLLFIGFIVALITSYFTIFFFIRLVERIGFLPFVIYRILLGALLFLL